MKSEQPLVSIIVCTYNGEKYLQQQLNSLENQSYPNIEIIISDNKSMDATPTIIDSWANGKQNVKLFSAEEKGLNKNFFSALKKASGEYVIFCDQDDIWLNNKVEKLIAFYKENNEASMIYCLSKPFSNNIPDRSVIHKHINYLTGNDVKKTMIICFTLGHNICIKRELLLSLPEPENEIIAYDWWITVSAMCVGSIKCLPEMLTFWRKHEQNTTTQLITGKFYQNSIKFLQQFYLHPSISVENKKWIKKAITQFDTLQNKQFSISLFLFLMNNANTLFFYKTKKNPILKWISYTKWCFKMSKASYSVPV